MLFGHTKDKPDECQLGSVSVIDLYSEKIVEVLEVPNVLYNCVYRTKKLKDNANHLTRYLKFGDKIISENDKKNIMVKRLTDFLDSVKMKYSINNVICDSVPTQYVD